MIIFPDTIDILILDKDLNKPVPNIAVRIKLFAKHKNDYNFILPLSDEKGCIKITRDWLEEEIRKEQTLFVMDYSSKLNDCNPEIEITVLNTEELLRAVNAMYVYKDAIGISDDEIRRYKNANNSKYLPWKEKIIFESYQGEKVVFDMKKVIYIKSCKRDER